MKMSFRSCPSLVPSLTELYIRFSESAQLFRSGTKLFKKVPVFSSISLIYCYSSVTYGQKMTILLGIYSNDRYFECWRLNTRYKIQNVVAR